MSDETLDCVVIGGGPAGLTAAVYLARSRRKFAVLNAGESRAEWIPKSRNTPGFPDGVTGPDLLDRMRVEARKFATPVISARVERVERSEDGFVVRTGERRTEAKTLILATGIKDRIPEHQAALEAVKRGVLRLCPICDGYETQGKHVGVVGCSDHAAAEALFLRTYSDRVTLVLTDPGQELDDARRRELADARVRVVQANLDAVRFGDTAVHCPSDAGELRFDTAYCAYGVNARSELAAQLGAEMSEDGRLTVDAHQQTSVTGLYAAGDIVLGLNQITVACAEAAIAAIAIHNRLPRNYA